MQGRHLGTQIHIHPFARCCGHGRDTALTSPSHSYDRCIGKGWGFGDGPRKPLAQLPKVRAGSGSECHRGILTSRILVHNPAEQSVKLPSDSSPESTRENKLPSSPAQGIPAIRRMLSHTSGLPDSRTKSCHQRWHTSEMAYMA